MSILSKIFNKQNILGAAIVTIPLLSNAGFEMYDDFSGTTIDSSRWDLDESSAAFSLSGTGLLKIDLNTAVFDDSAWMQMKKDLGSIKGIRARMYLANNCVGDHRVRIAAEIGQRGQNYLWAYNAIRVRTSGAPYDEFINAYLGEFNVQTDEEVADLMYAEQPTGKNVDVTGKWVNMSLFFDATNRARYWSYLDGKTDGQIYKTFSPPVTINSDRFMGLGTRSGDDGVLTSPCTAWVNWIQVYK